MRIDKQFVFASLLQAAVLSTFLMLLTAIFHS